MTETSHLTFGSNLVKKKHEAMIEFAPDIIVKFTAPRHFSAEMTRHRLCSFAETSTRYVNYKDGVTFMCPHWVNYDIIKKEFTESVSVTDSEIGLMPDFNRWVNNCLYSEKTYKKLIEEGWKPQDARGVLPLDLKTEICVKANVRNWRNIFKLRCDPTAHPIMRKLMIPLLKELKSKVPILFDDIIIEKEVY
jgi:thymidylate synthase (FAD)